ncbi:hypothetical protein Glove_681g13 [Diversispora epigaea]|uniref:Uncharacterized protein n=1 Tax=Diversispora epigaea TaxID=1348612 RepID=A0A397G2Q3_9GLOM|nr:hypothetical protein Glove_681g13 [Diversispora epigaea]
MVGLIKKKKTTIPRISQFNVPYVDLLRCAFNEKSISKSFSLQEVQKSGKTRVTAVDVKNTVSYSAGSSLGGDSIPGSTLNDKDEKGNKEMKGIKNRMASVIISKMLLTSTISVHSKPELKDFLARIKTPFELVPENTFEIIQPNLVKIFPIVSNSLIGQVMLKYPSLVAETTLW